MITPIAFLVVSQLVPQVEISWSTKFVDCYDYLPTSEVLQTEVDRKLLDVIDKEPSRAYQAFKTMYEKNDTRSLVCFGLILSAKRAGSLADALEVVSSRYGVRRGVGGNRSNVLPENCVVLPFRFGILMSMRTDMTTRRVTSIVDKLGSHGSLLYSSLSGAKVNADELDRCGAALFGSVALEQSDRTSARFVLSRYVDRNPSDPVTRVLLYRAYQFGAVKMVHGTKEVPVPESERPRPELAKPHIMAAVSLLTPKSSLKLRLDTLYFAGSAERESRPTATKYYWQRLLELQPAGKRSPRLDYVRQWLKDHS
jgi:hypothetical protein